MNLQILVIFLQNWSKQEVIHYVLRSTNVLNLFGIRKNYQSSGTNLLLYISCNKNRALEILSHTGSEISVQLAP
jgi:hypothetical protein